MQQQYSVAEKPAIEPLSGSRYISSLPRLRDISAASWRWRSVWSSVPALLLLGLAAGAAQLSPPQPLTGGQSTPVAANVPVRADWERGVIPLRDTALVSTSASSLSGRGTLQALGGAQVKAPVGGQVARVLVKVGDEVKLGDPILEVSSGAVSRGPLPVEGKQSRAEQAQVEAAQDQAKLQAHMMDSQSRLHEAQLRVAAAQRRLEQARGVLEEAKADAGLPSAAPSARKTEIANRPKATKKVPAKADPAQAGARAARDKAARDAKAAEAAARDAAGQVSSATRAADAAARQESEASEKLSDARREYSKAQEQFNSGEAKGSEVEIARGAVEDAQRAAQSVKSQAEKMRAELRQARDAAAPAQRDAEQARQELAQSVQQLRVFSDAPAPTGSAPRPVETAPRVAPSRVAPRAAVSPGRPRRSIAEAAKIVRAAIAESRVAIARADKLKKEAQGYGGKVETVNESLTSSTQQLEAAQQSVLDSTVRAQFTGVRAPAAGRITQVATIASDVAAGDVVAGIGQNNRLKVYFQDSTEGWKSLRKDARLPVIVFAPGAVSGGVPTAARVESIEPPKAVGQPAIILAMVHNPASVFAPGWEVRAADAALPQLFVAQNALLRDHDLIMAAVLKPQVASDEYVVEWRMLKLGRQIGEQWEVLDGLKAGERVALQPAALHAYSLERGEKATIRLVS